MPREVEQAQSPRRHHHRLLYAMRGPHSSPEERAAAAATDADVHAHLRAHMPRHLHAQLLQRPDGNDGDGAMPGAMLRHGQAEAQGTPGVHGLRVLHFSAEEGLQAAHAALQLHTGVAVVVPDFALRAHPLLQPLDKATVAKDSSAGEAAAAAQALAARQVPRRALRQGEQGRQGGSERRDPLLPGQWALPHVGLDKAWASLPPGACWAALVHDAPA